MFQWDFYLERLVRPANMTQSMAHLSESPTNSDRKRKLTFSKAFRDSQRLKKLDEDEEPKD